MVRFAVLNGERGSQHFVAADVSAKNRAEYGLDEPVLVVDLHLAGETRSLRLGNQTREQTRMYADRAPGSDVYVIPTDAFESWLSTPCGAGSVLVERPYAPFTTPVRS